MGMLCDAPMLWKKGTKGQIVKLPADSCGNYKTHDCSIRYFAPCKQQALFAQLSAK